MAAQITIYNFESCSFGCNFSIKTTITIKLHTGNNITVIMSTVSYVKYLLQLFKFKVILKKKKRNAKGSFKYEENFSKYWKCHVNLA